MPKEKQQDLFNPSKPSQGKKKQSVAPSQGGPQAAQPGPCEIVCIVDKSGSMASMRDEAIQAFNAFLDTHRKLPGKANVTVTLFNTEVEKLVEGEDLSTVKNLTTETYVPGGGTAMLDATGDTLSEVRSRIAGMPDSSKPESVSAAIITDGRERDSREWEKESLLELLEELRGNGWDIQFLAADEEQIADARENLGFTGQSATSFAPSGQGYRGAVREMVDRSAQTRLGADYTDEVRCSALANFDEAAGTDEEDDSSQWKDDDNA